MDGKYITIGDLKAILERCPDDMKIALPIISEDICNLIHHYRLITTVDIIENSYGISDKGVLYVKCICMSQNIKDQIKDRKSDVEYIKVLI